MGVPNQCANFPFLSIIVTYTPQNGEILKVCGKYWSLQGPAISALSPFLTGPSYIAKTLDDLKNVCESLCHKGNGVLLFDYVFVKILHDEGEQDEHNDRIISEEGDDKHEDDIALHEERENQQRQLCTMLEVV